MARFPATLRANVTDVTGITSDDVMRLAERVGRLSPSHRDPERFHADKSQIVSELRRLAREIAA